MKNHPESDSPDRLLEPEKYEAPGACRVLELLVRVQLLVPHDWSEEKSADQLEHSMQRDPHIRGAEALQVFDLHDPTNITVTARTSDVDALIRHLIPPVSIERIARHKQWGDNVQFTFHGRTPYQVEQYLLQLMGDLRIDGFEHPQDKK
jgi:hypothetical protein